MQDSYERQEQKQRAQAWYAILGLGALTAGVLVIMSFLPNNPFHVPSELPGTSQLNSEALTGANQTQPLLPVTPSERAAVGPGCRVSDIALVQEQRNALRQTVSEGLMAYAARRSRFEGQGWTDTKLPYDRFPATAEETLRPDVWNLSRHSAGMAFNRR